MQSIALQKNTILNHSKKEITVELGRVLQSKLFSRSSVLSNFLKFIVEETLEEHTDGLKEYTIAVCALGKSEDFNPQVDAIVRIHAGRLRRLLNEYYTDEGKSDPIRIEVIKGTYVPVFRPLIQAGSDLNLEEAKVLKLFSRTKLTLAVLPFRNLCPNCDYQFFADGFGEELTRIFSNFQGISVIAHHSTLKYASAPADVRLIGSDLGVHYLITGSVKRTSDEIRVSVGLVETINGLQVWSQTYMHPLNIDNLIYIQDQIVKNICFILGGIYGFIIRESSKTHRDTIANLDSFDAALWNCYFHMNFSEETYLQTREAVEKAVERDPDYAMGLAMLTELYLSAKSLGYPTVEDPLTTAYALAKKATKIDPQCQHAFQELGWANIHLKRKAEALEALDRCLELNPSSISAVGSIGFGMACLGEYKRASIMLTQAIQLNPNCPWWFYLGFFLVHYHKKQYDKALECANRIEGVDIFLDPLSKAAARAELGNYEEAAADVHRFTKTFPDIAANPGAYLSSFILDDTLTDSILAGIKKAGFSIV